MDAQESCSKGGEEQATEDHSILCRPIQTGASAVKMIVNSLKNGTPEIRDLLLNESDIIFECKVCRSLHRSFVNFIAHKRTYCLKHLCESMQLFNENFAEEDEALVVQPEEVPEEAELTPETSMEEVNAKEAEDEKLEAEEERLTPEIKAENGSESTSTPRKLFSFQDRKLRRRWHRVSANNVEAGESSGTSATSKFYQSCVNHVRRSRRVETRLELRSIASNPNAVFQTVSCASESPRTRPVVQLELSAQAQVMAVKNLVQGGDKKRNCVKCGKRFKSLRKMMVHVQTVHAKTRTFYPCLLCKTQFSNIWGCIRHLMRFHKKTKMQVEKLKDKIKAKAVEKTVEDQKPESNQQNQVQEPVVPVPVQLPVISQPVVHLENTPVFQCSICSKVFSQKPSLDGHRSSCLTKQRLAAAAALNAAKQQSDPAMAEPVPVPAVPEEPRSTRPRRIVKKKMLDEGFVNSSHLNIRTNSVNVPKKSPEASPPAEPGNRKTENGKFVRRLNAIIDNRSRQCLKCKQTFVTISNARRHAAAHIGYHRYRCRKCEFHAYGRAQIRCHILKAHVDDRNRAMKQSEMDRLIVSLENEPEESEEEEEDAQPEVKQEEEEEEESRKRGVLAPQAHPGPVEDHAEEEVEGEHEPEVVGGGGAGEWHVNLGPPCLAASASGSDSFIRCIDVSENSATSPVYIFEFADEDPEAEPETKRFEAESKRRSSSPDVVVKQEQPEVNGDSSEPEMTNGEAEVFKGIRTRNWKTYAKKAKVEPEGEPEDEAGQEAEVGEPEAMLRDVKAALYKDHNYFSLENGSLEADAEVIPEEPPLAVRRMRRGLVERQELLKAVGSIIK